MSIETPPTAPDRSQTPAVFDANVDAYHTWLEDDFIPGVNAIAQAGDFDASLWVSGTSYVIGNRVYSPTNYATYRRITNGAGTTDPSADTTNWAPIVESVTVPGIAQGRLTLTTALPVTTADVTGATTVYYTPHVGNTIPIYNGTKFVQTEFTEVSQATTDATKSPAAVANNSNYDLFVWSDSGTVRCTRGPAWSSDTARGTGAGTTELERVKGLYVNKVAITNGPAANRGTYVGTIRSDGSAQINDSLLKRHVWNNYNRAPRPMVVVDTTNSWNYSTASWQQANASAANQVDYVVGLSEDPVDARVVGRASSSTSTFRNVFVGVGVDSSTVNSAGLVTGAQANNGSNSGTTTAFYRGFPGIGRHTLRWLEYGAGADTQTFEGDLGLANTLQSGLQAEVMQ